MAFSFGNAGQAAAGTGHPAQAQTGPDLLEIQTEVGQYLMMHPSF